MTTLTAKKLIVTAIESELDNDGKESRYTFPVLEYENGLIQVPSDTTNDWFFNAREEIEPNGLARTELIEETGETQEIKISWLKDWIVSSEEEFGAVPKKAWDLINSYD